MNRNWLLMYLCGIWACFTAESDAHNAIVGGDFAQVGQFPYQVSLQVNNRHICGGGIISSESIVTSAHCVIRNNTIITNKRITVLAGTNNLQQTTDPAVIIEVTKIFVPVDYIPSLSTDRNDLSVVKLKYPLELSKNKHLQQLKLPKDIHMNYAGKTAKIAGFGWDWIIIENNKERGNNSNKRLRFAETSVLSNSQCQLSFPIRQIPEKQICAKTIQHHAFNRGVCIGDSGGPLVYDGTTVIGVLSSSPNGCTERTVPAIYIRVTHYMDFIKHAILHKKSDEDAKAQHELNQGHWICQSFYKLIECKWL